MNYHTWSKVFFVLVIAGGLCSGFASLTTVSYPWNFVGECLMSAMQLVWLVAIIQYNKTKTTRNQIIMLSRIGVLLALPILFSPWLDNPVTFDRILFHSSIPHTRMLLVALLLTYATLLLTWSVCVFVQMYRKWHGARNVLWMYLILLVCVDIVGVNLLPETHTMSIQVIRFAVGAIFGSLFFYIAYKVCDHKSRYER